MRTFKRLLTFIKLLFKYASFNVTFRKKIHVKITQHHNKKKLKSKRPAKLIFKADRSDAGCRGRDIASLEGLRCRITAEELIMPLTKPEN